MRIEDLKTGDIFSLELLASDFKDSTYLGWTRDNDIGGCPIEQFYKRLTGIKVTAGTNDILKLGNRLLSQFPGYYEEDYNKDYPLAEEAGFNETVIRTIEMTVL